MSDDRGAAARPRLSVVLPAYEEQDRIAATVDRVRDGLGDLARDGLEVVVVDDGSRDATAAEAKRAGADQVVVLDENRGKGAAVKAGVLAARGRAIAYTDADLSYSADHLLRLLAAVEAGADMVVGSRRHRDAVALARAGRLREVSGRVFNWVTARVVLGSERDTQCGLKAFSAAAAQALFERARLDGFAFDVELFVIADRLGLRVEEIPVELNDAPGSTVRVAPDAARMVRDLFRIRRWARQGAYD